MNLGLKILTKPCHELGGISFLIEDGQRRLIIGKWGDPVGGLQWRHVGFKLYALMSPATLIVAGVASVIGRSVGGVESAIVGALSRGRRVARICLLAGSLITRLLVAILFGVLLFIVVGTATANDEPLTDSVSDEVPFGPGCSILANIGIEFHFDEVVLLQSASLAIVVRGLLELQSVEAVLSTNAIVGAVLDERRVVRSVAVLVFLALASTGVILVVHLIRQDRHVARSIAAVIQARSPGVLK